MLTEHIIDAAYCYKCSIVCVCLLVTTMSPTEKDELIKVLSKVRTRVVPRNHVVSAGPDPHREGAIMVGASFGVAYIIVLVCHSSNSPITNNAMIISNTLSIVWLLLAHCKVQRGSRYLFIP